MTALQMVCPAAPVPSHADRDREHARHDHRLDLTPTMVRLDPWYETQPERLYAELAATYGDEAARTLWALAAEVEL